MKVNTGLGAGPAAVRRHSRTDPASDHRLSRTPRTPVVATRHATPARHTSDKQIAVSPSYPSPAGRGQVFDNPVTGEHVVVLTDPYTNPDRALVSDLSARPGTRVSGPHIHPESTERFHVVRGTVAFTIGGTERLLGPGEYAEVPSGVVHDWWQMGDEEARVVVEVTPGDRFAEIARTMIGLARDGKVTRRGAPPLLQLAVITQEYQDVFVMASPPPWVQRPLFAALAPAGRLMGLRASYPKYLESAEIEEPAAEALALLDEHGRLRWNADARPLDLEL